MKKVLWMAALTVFLTACGDKSGSDSSTTTTTTPASTNSTTTTNK